MCARSWRERERERERERYERCGDDSVSFLTSARNATRKEEELDLLGVRINTFIIKLISSRNAHPIGLWWRLSSLALLFLQRQRCRARSDSSVIRRRMGLVDGLVDRVDGNTLVLDVGDVACNTRGENNLN